MILDTIMSNPKLFIVNKCLTSVGLAPVTMFDENDEDTAEALNALSEATYTFQSDSYWFNSYEKTYPVLVESRMVRIPPNVIDLLSRDYTFKYSDEINSQALWVIDDNDFYKASTGVTTSPSIMTVFGVDVDAMPLVARAYVAASTLRIFSLTQENDLTKERILIAKEVEALNKLQGINLRQQRTNLLDNTYANKFLLHSSNARKDFRS